MSALCCAAFRRAMETGTDNEAYSKLIFPMHGQWTIGSDLPPMAFCPWCGFRLTAPREDQR